MHGEKAKKILIVDDERDILECLTMILVEEGYSAFKYRFFWQARAKQRPSCDGVQPSVADVCVDGLCLVAAAW